MSLWLSKAGAPPAAWRECGGPDATPRGRTLCVDELLQRFYAADDAQSEVRAGALLVCSQPRIRALLRRIGARGEDLEDLCQDGNIRLLGALRGSRAPSARHIERWDKYVATITLSVYRDFWRKRVRTWTHSLEEMTRCEDGNPDGALPASTEDVAAAVASAIFAEEMREQFWREICVLPPQQRGALLLHLEQDDLLRLQGRKSTIASALGIARSEFRESVWPALPLSDREIAGRLGIGAGGKTSAEKRVSNRRECALKRLGRFWSRSDSWKHLP